MAWNEELTRTFGRRCIECGLAFADGEPRKHLSLGHAIHEDCYGRVLEQSERSALGKSGEENERSVVRRERAKYLQRDENREREKLAFERTKELFGVETAERIERLLCETMKTNPPKNTA